MTRLALASIHCGTNSAFVTGQRSPASAGGEKVKQPREPWLPQGSLPPERLTAEPAISSPMP
ncbi:hypothetical protein ACFYWY_09120 [Streptomyces sp. NPDC002870]|uniref:hypothetical protein n=1 Tax=Streptomyces sp. NPDC002870 TaxID=3364666 RepID=UPI0036CF58D6